MPNWIGLASLMPKNKDLIKILIKEFYKFDKHDMFDTMVSLLMTLEGGRQHEHQEDGGRPRGGAQLLQGGHHAQRLSQNVSRGNRTTCAIPVIIKHFYMAKNIIIFWRLLLTHSFLTAKQLFPELLTFFYAIF